MVADTREPVRDYPIPDEANKVKEEFPRLSLAVQAIATDVASVLTALAGKAALTHTHAIGNVTGLQSALDGKASSNHQHAFDDLSDVDLTGVSNYQVPMWNGTAWVPWTVDLAHAVGVAEVDLSGYYTKTQTDTAISNASSLRTPQYFSVGRSNATVGQTSFSVVGGYTAGYIDVFLNGVLLEETADYTASNGTTVVLGAGIASSDTLMIRPWKVQNLTTLGAYALTSYVDTQIATRQAAATPLSQISALTWASGDLLYAGAGGALARLGKGTDGQVLALATGLPAWVSISGRLGADLSIVAGDIVYGSGANTLARLAKGTDGQILALASGLPSWVSISGRLGADLSIVAGDIVYGSGANTLARLAKGTDGQILTLASGLPSWANAPATGVATDNGALAVGSFAILRKTNSGSVNSGSTINGSNLSPFYYQASGSAWTNGGSASGSWRNVSGITITQSDAGLFQRIS